MNRKEKQSNLMSQFNLIDSPAHITYWDIYGMHVISGVAVYNLDTMAIYHIETIGM